MIFIKSNYTDIGTDLLVPFIKLLRNKNTKERASELPLHSYCNSRQKREVKCIPAHKPKPLHAM